MNFEISGIFPTPVYKAVQPVEKDVLLFCEKQSKSWNQDNKLSHNKEILNETEMKQVKIFIEQHLQNYIDQIWNPKDEVKPFLTQSWLNFTNPGESHHPHTHSNAFISGVYYIKTLPIDFLNFDRENWFIKLYPLNANIYNSHKVSVQVNQGDLLLFPPNIIHGTNKNETDNLTRISLAFNAFIKGDIGSVENLTYLKI
jgi:uncharacterized protein (TIGR02466 family)